MVGFEPILDLRNERLNSIEVLDFSSVGSGGVNLAEINADQFGTGLSSTATINADVGIGKEGRLSVYMEDMLAVKLSTLNFNGWISIEEIIITGDSNNESMIGTENNDEIYGNGGDDTLEGGLGNDTLDGGSGSDHFIFNTTPTGTNVDVISTFGGAGTTGTSEEDLIVLDNSVFGGLTDGELLADPFRYASDTATATALVVYDQTTGELFFDPDGNGVGGSVQFTTLDTFLGLPSEDFLII